MAKGGTMTLTANGRKIGEGRVEKTTPFKYSLYEGQEYLYRLAKTLASP